MKTIGFLLCPMQISSVPGCLLGFPLCALWRLFHFYLWKWNCGISCLFFSLFYSCRNKEGIKNILSVKYWKAWSESNRTLTPAKIWSWTLLPFLIQKPRFQYKLYSFFCAKFCSKSQICDCQSGNKHFYGRGNVLGSLEPVENTPLDTSQSRLACLNFAPFKWQAGLCEIRSE